MVIDTSSWGWPQYVVLLLLAFRLLTHGAQHGKSMSALNFNVGGALFYVMLMLLLLGAGGFFAARP